MASKLYDRALPALTLEKMRGEMKKVADTLNAKRMSRGTKGFANVYVGAVLEYPLTRKQSFVITYTEDDRMAERLIRIVEQKLVEESRGRLLRLEQVTEKFFELRQGELA